MTVPLSAGIPTGGASKAAERRDDSWREFKTCIAKVEANVVVLYITPEAFNPGIVGVFAICLFRRYYPRFR